jgi:hypothetical protein
MLRESVNFPQLLPGQPEAISAQKLATFYWRGADTAAARSLVPHSASAGFTSISSDSPRDRLRFLTGGTLSLNENACTSIRKCWERSKILNRALMAAEKGTYIACNVSYHSQHNGLLSQLQTANGSRPFLSFVQAGVGDSAP